MRIRHQYKAGSSVELRFYAVREYAGTIENRIFRDIRWATRAELPTYDFLEADVKLVKDLADGRLL
jgi:8-oxo-dGTP diphosphatase